MAKAGAAPFDAGGNGHDEVFSADAAFLLGGCRGSCICRHTLVQLLRQVAKAGHGGIDDRAAVQLHRRAISNHGGLGFLCSHSIPTAQSRISILFLSTQLHC